MPEGFSHAALVPGDKYFFSRHSNYLPKIFEVIKSKEPKAIVSVYHFMSTLPEVVGYKGKVYQIKNAHDTNGQATFKIQDYKTYEIFKVVNSCNTLEELQAAEKCIKGANKYSKYIKEILLNALNHRQTMIKKIQNCQTQEKLDELINAQEEEFLWGDLMGLRFYAPIAERQSFRIAENEAQNLLHSA